MNRKSLLALFSLTAIGIISCGGGGGGSGSASGGGSESVNGRAIDGPLAGAKVCLDKNLNSKCDDGEPFTYTDDNGDFTLNINPQDAKSNYPILVEVTENTQGNEAGGNYTLVAPLDNQSLNKTVVVSPLTSLVFSEMEKNGLDLEEAKEYVQNILGDDPFKDYIEDNNQTLQNIAKNIAKVVADTLNDLSKDPQMAKFVKEHRLEVVIIILDSLKNYIEDFKSNNANINEIEQNIKNNKDELITSIEALVHMKNKKPVKDIVKTFNSTFVLSTTDGTHLSQRIIKYQEYKAKLKNINAESDLREEVKSKYYDIDKLYGGYEYNNETLTINYDNYTWRVLNAYEVDLEGKTMDGCLLFGDEFDRVEAREYMPDLCQNVTFNEPAKIYMFSMQLQPMSANDNQILLKLAKSINKHNYDWMSVYSNFDNMINSQTYGSSNNTFSFDHYHELQFKPSDSEDKGDIVLKDNGADVGDYWFITDNQTSEKFLVMNTVFGSALGRQMDDNKVLFKYFYTKPEVHTFLSLDNATVKTFLNTVKSTIKPLPDEATYPAIGYQNATSVFETLFNGNELTIIGRFASGNQNWANCNNGICSKNCTVNYDESTNTMTIQCGSSDIEFEVYPFNRDYTTILIKKDSNPENRLTNVLNYLDNDTACFEAGYFNRAENYFCITSAQPPDKDTLSQMVQPGSYYAFFDSEGAWKLKYCIHFEDNGDGTLEFKAYNYENSTTFNGTVTIDDNGVLKLTKLSNNSELISKVVKVNQDKGIILGFSNSTGNWKYKTIRLMVETNSCPSF